VEFLRETKPKDFLMAMKVKAGAAGKDIATNGLQDIAGLYITAITRPSTQQTFQDILPTFELQVRAPSPGAREGNVASPALLSSE